MPMVPQNPVTQNAVLLPQIMIQTKIVDGALVSSGSVTYQAAFVDTDGKWEIAGSAKVLFLENLNSLPDDLASISNDMGFAEGALINVLNEINGIRKLV